MHDTPSTSPARRRAALLLLAALLAPAGPALAMGSGGGGEDDGVAAAKAAIADGDYQGAIAKLKKMRGEDPKNADVLNLLGYASRKTGNRDAALEYYQAALAVEPKHRGANEYLGELYLETGQLEKAEERLAVLDKACLFSCDEFDELKNAIAAYKKANGIKP